MVDTPRLKALMRAKGVTQRSLGECIGMDKNSLNAKLNGQRAFKANEIVAICDALGVETAEEICALFLAKGE